MARRLFAAAFRYLPCVRSLTMTQSELRPLADSSEGPEGSQSASEFGSSRLAALNRFQRAPAVPQGHGPQSGGAEQVAAEGRRAY